MLVVCIDELSCIIMRKNELNFVKIIKAFDGRDVFWFCDLQEASGIHSVTYFRSSLFKLVRRGVLVEVKRGLYSIDRNKIKN